MATGISGPGHNSLVTRPPSLPPDTAPRPILLNFNSQAEVQSSRFSLLDAIRSVHSLFYSQEIPLPRSNEPAAVVTVLRLLGGEARLPIGGHFARCAGSSPLAMVALHVYPWIERRRRASRLTDIIAERFLKGNPP